MDKVQDSRQGRMIECYDSRQGRMLWFIQYERAKKGRHCHDFS